MLEMNGEGSIQMSFNLAVILTETAAASPGKVVAIHGGGQLTYAELDVLSGRLAPAWRAKGSVQGIRWRCSCPTFPSSWLPTSGSSRPAQWSCR